MSLQGKTMKYIWLLFFIIPVFLFSQDDADVSYKEVPLQGSLKKGTYYAPNNLFKFTIPPLEGGGYVEDAYIRDNENNLTQGGVRFEDDCGTLVRIEFDMIPGYLCEKMLDQRYNDSLLHQTLCIGIMTLIRRVCPNAEILHEEVVLINGDQHAIFAIILLPNGGTIIDPETETRVNAARSYLITREGNYIVYMSEQDFNNADNGSEVVELYKDRLKRLLNEMIYYYNTLKWCG
jgi:hypothetical protein